MHRSRVGVVLIDHPEDRYDSARAFWAAALGTEAQPQPGGPYESFGVTGGVVLELQRTGVGTAPRVHLDIETDDVDAEVTRLRTLGASVAAEHDEYTVMADPAGVAFCVVPVQTGETFEQHATTWE